MINPRWRFDRTSSNPSQSQIRTPQRLRYEGSRIIEYTSTRPRGELWTASSWKQCKRVLVVMWGLSRTRAPVCCCAMRSSPSWVRDAEDEVKVYSTRRLADVYWQLSASWLVGGSHQQRAEWWSCQPRPATYHRSHTYTILLGPWIAIVMIMQPVQRSRSKAFRSLSGRINTR